MLFSLVSCPTPLLMPSLGLGCVSCLLLIGHWGLDSVSCLLLIGHWGAGQRLMPPVDRTLGLGSVSCLLLTGHGGWRPVRIAARGEYV